MQWYIVISKNQQQPSQHLFVPLMLTLNTFPTFSSVSIVNFEHVIADWEVSRFQNIENCFTRD